MLKYFLKDPRWPKIRLTLLTNALMSSKAWFNLQLGMNGVENVFNRTITWSIQCIIDISVPCIFNQFNDHWVFVISRYYKYPLCTKGCHLANSLTNRPKIPRYTHKNEQDVYLLKCKCHENWRDGFYLHKSPLTSLFHHCHSQIIHYSCVSSFYHTFTNIDVQKYATFVPINDVCCIFRPYSQCKFTVPTIIMFLKIHGVISHAYRSIIDFFA